jgi:hypothetical protein
VLGTRPCAPGQHVPCDERPESSMQSVPWCTHTQQYESSARVVARAS